MGRGTPSSWTAELLMLKYVPSLDVAWVCCFLSAWSKSSFPGERQQGKQPCPGQVWQGGRAGSRAGTVAASATFYSERGQVDADLYLLRTCFLNIINSDYCPQISLQNLRVIGFYNAVKKDINWFRDWLDNHLHHSFINIAIIWHFWMEEDCKAPADPVKHVKWRLVLLLSLSLVKDN